VLFLGQNIFTVDYSDTYLGNS